jgi:hypothetical protein
MLGVLIIIIGILILIYYKGLKKNEKGGLTFKLIGAGIGFIIIGISLIIRELV